MQAAMRRKYDPRLTPGEERALAIDVVAKWLASVQVVHKERKNQEWESTNCTPNAAKKRQENVDPGVHLLFSERRMRRLTLETSDWQPHGRPGSLAPAFTRIRILSWVRGLQPPTDSIASHGAFRSSRQREKLVCATRSARQFRSDAWAQSSRRATASKRPLQQHLIQVKDADASLPET
jgi:hypothetical protein